MRVKTYAVLGMMLAIPCAILMAQEAPSAPPVVTLGQLADVTADLVIDSAQADLAEAQRAAGSRIEETSHNSPSVAARPDAPSIDDVAHVGAMVYVTLHYGDGSVSSVPAGQLLPGGYRVEATSVGAQIVDDGSGLVLSRSGNPPSTRAPGPADVPTFPAMNSRPMPIAPPVATPPPPMPAPGPGTH